MSEKCTSCAKGLEYVMNIILSGDTVKFDKLRLCPACKILMNKAVKQALKEK